MDVNELRGSGHIIYESIVGSKLYGLDTPSSDTDIKGIYMLPLKEIFKRSHQDQVNDDKNDQVFYEIKRFLTLAGQANPNILELLYTPDEFVIQKSPAFELIKENRDKFLTKNIKNSLGGYAIAQIKKARGKNKKIVNPIDKVRKTPLDFCQMIRDGQSVPIHKWLERCGWNQKDFGVVNIDKAHNVYSIYHNKGKYDFRGIILPDSNELRLSSIPKELTGCDFTMYFASEAYSTYCKDYKEYWDWMDKRNESRYISVENHNKGYDGKNLMHCFRLLNMGIDAAEKGTLIVNRAEDREWLLDVREGKFEYNELIDKAEELKDKMDNLVGKSDLPDTIKDDVIDDLLIELRTTKWDD